MALSDVTSPPAADAGLSAAVKAAPIVVSSDAALTLALTTVAKTGGVILLDGNGGPYTIEAKNFGSSATPITIGALDPAKPPVVEKIVMTNVSYVTLTGLDVRGGVPDGTGTIQIAGSDHVGLVGNTMTGIANGFLSETGTATRGNSLALIRDSQNIFIADNKVSGFFHGFGILEVKGLTLIDNDISKMQGDGFRGGGIQDAVISGNNFHDFYGSTQTLNHSDMIQIWGSGAQSLTQNITISGNTLDTGDGAATQSIFIRNEEFGLDNTPTSGYYQNITITDNVIRNGAFNGITVADARGVTVDNNTLLWDPDARTQTTGTSGLGGSTDPTIFLNNTPGAVITDNIAGRINDLTAGATRDPSNYLINYTDPSAPNYVDAHFVNVLGADPIDTSLRSDSPLYGTVGSGLSSEPPTDTLAAVILQSDVPGNALGVHLAGGLTWSHGAPIDTATATALWTLSDGSKLTGWDVNHVFKTPGTYSVQLLVTDATGHTDTLTRSIVIEDPTLFRFNFDGKTVVDLSGHASDVTLRGNVGAYAAGQTSDGFHLTGTSALIVSGTNTQINNLLAFDLTLGFRADRAGNTGMLMSQQGIMGLSILTKGALQFSLTTAEGTFKIITNIGLIADTKWHNIGLNYDGNSGTMSVLVDGHVVGSTAAHGVTAAPTAYGLCLGNPWGTSIAGVVDNFAMTLPANPGASDSSAVSIPPPPPPPPASVTLADINFSDHGADHSAYASLISVNDVTNTGFVAGRDETGFHLTGSTGFRVENENSQIYGLDAFDLSLAFRKDSAVGYGGLLNQNTILNLQILKTGALEFRLQTDAGVFRVTTAAGLMSDTNWHNISLHYDNASGKVSILFDGSVAAEGAAHGTTANPTAWSLVVGNPWGASVPGVVDDLLMTKPAPVAAASAMMAHVASDATGDATHAAMAASVPDHHAADDSISALMAMMKHHDAAANYHWQPDLVG